AFLNAVVFPVAVMLFAGILIPPDAFGEPGAADHVWIAVAVDVQNEVAEVIDVAVLEIDIAKVVFGPTRSFVPVLAGNDIELAIVIAMGEGSGLGGAEIDGDLSKGNLSRPVDCEDGDGTGEHAYNDGPLLHGEILSYA